MSPVIYRVDASDDLGVGHLQRCLSLAHAFTEQDMAAVFVCNDHPASRQRVEAANHDYVPLSSPSWQADDLQTTVQTARRAKAEIIIVDSDYEGADYLAQLKAAGLYTVTIEDIATHAFPVDLLINPDAHGHLLDYDILSTTQTLLGPEHAILNPSYWAVEPSPVSEHVQRILLTTGGGDRLSLMPSLVETVAESAPQAQISVVIGPFFTHQEAIQLAAAPYQGRVHLVTAPNGLRHLIEQADLCVTAGGQTLYELARLGCPTIAFTIATNQEAQTQAFADVQAITHIGNAITTEILPRLAMALQKLLTDPEARQTMHQAGPRFIDGQGARRLVRQLAGYVQAAR